MCVCVCVCVCVYICHSLLCCCIIVDSAGESLREKLVHECKERELKQEQLSRRINDVEERLSAYR